MNQFINDKAAEIIAAANSGNDQALQAAFNEAIRESAGTPEQALADLTAAVNQQKGA
ncbi:hypothetical protein ACFWJU_18585 [Streptomyces mutabilis]|uniref:hypothetical protein n=1 Tax=Streptomyces mutabilis TaxID=67332 RepID=UPI00365208F4